MKFLICFILFFYFTSVESYRFTSNSKCYDACDWKYIYNDGNPDYKAKKRCHRDCYTAKILTSEQLAATNHWSSSRAMSPVTQNEKNQLWGTVLSTIVWVVAGSLIILTFICYVAVAVFGCYVLWKRISLKKRQEGEYVKFRKENL